MKPARNPRAAFLLFLAMPFALVSCALFPPQEDLSQYYVLASLDETGDSKQLASDSGLVIQVGPTTIATYLDRNQIVSRKSTNELKVAEFHVWGEPLDEGVSRVVTRNLAQLLDSASVAPDVNPVDFDYRVRLHINRFEATGKGSVILDCSWVISGAPGSSIEKTARTSKITVPLEQPAAPDSDRKSEAAQSREATAAAMSEAINRLSVEVAGKLLKLGKPVVEEEEAAIGG